MNAAAISKKFHYISFKVRENVEDKEELKKAEYLEMIDRGIKQIKEGRGILMTDAELERMLNE